MPMGNTSAGVHDDGLHQTSAKRDNVAGVAGLDAQGNLLAKHDTVYIPRGLADKTFLTERTSGELLLEMERIAAQDYVFTMEVAAARQTILNTSHLNVVGYVPGLDSNGFISPVVAPCAPVMIDLGLGVTHPFVTVATTGAGTVVDDAAGYLNMNSGASQVGYGSFIYTRHTGMRDFETTLSLDIVNFYGGLNGIRTSFIGFKEDHLTIDRLECVMIEIDSAGDCLFITGAAAASTTTAITSLSLYDAVHIVINDTTAYCYVNGILEAIHTTTIPTTNSMHGGVTHHSNASVTSGRSFGLGSLNITRSR